MPCGSSFTISITFFIAVIPVTIDFSSMSLQVTEGGDLTIPIQAGSAAAALMPITVPLQLMDGTAGGYLGLVG